MLKRSRDGESEKFAVHVLVHRLMGNWVECEDLTTQALTWSFQHIAAVLPTLDSEDDLREVISYAGAVLYRNEAAFKKSNIVIDTKARSDVSFIVGQSYLKEFATGSRLDRYYIERAVRYLEYTCNWQRNHDVADYREQLASLRALRKAHSLDPDTVLANRKVIDIQKEIVDLVTRKCPKYDPTRLNEQYSLSIEYVRANNYEKTVEVLQRVVEETNTLEDRDIRRRKSLYQLGKVHQQAAKYREMIKVFEMLDAIQGTLVDEQVCLEIKEDLRNAYLEVGELEKGMAVRIDG
ncbi:hypothetical protein F4678DRAFT_425528 [Xylaria arbuscula]|nr:hypothetical protein F4678DRAFT_425528 [Xylaria arbuscula]